MTRSAIYAGDVHHARFKPRRHRLHYRVFAMLLDLDEIPLLANRLFAHNRFAIFSFHDRDHGDGHTGTLRAWVEARVAEAGLPEAAHRIEILCYPRLFGYVFNPLTEYFCYDRSGTLRAVLHEVCNTYGERLVYVIRTDAEGGHIRHAALKLHFVSPFVPMNCRYQFNIVPPGERIRIGISESDPEGPLLTASFSGRRRAFTERELLRLLFAYPLMTLKITAAIHWEAAKLLAKGIHLHPHTPAAERRSVVVEQDKAAAERTVA
ncbi:DUF1365 domain-containing protein [Devosia sp. CN2-171]|uniref:DUF1365 domain-containing protein n=1 Tax=Devosia sp. CN2-171 TaxID=3400909 RepID=UPI003BF88EF2